MCQIVMFNVTLLSLLACPHTHVLWDTCITSSSNAGQKKKKGDKKNVMLKLDSSVILSTCTACSMYLSAKSVLVHIQAEILSGIAYICSVTI